VFLLFEWCSYPFFFFPQEGRPSKCCHSMTNPTRDSRHRVITVMQRSSLWQAMKDGYPHPYPEEITKLKEDLFLVHQGRGHSFVHALDCEQCRCRSLERTSLDYISRSVRLAAMIDALQGETVLAIPLLYKVLLTHLAVPPQSALSAILVEESV